MASIPRLFLVRTGWFQVICLAVALPVAALAEPQAKGRPAEWAQPLRLPGAPNLHKVNDLLYRGAQPTAEGFRELAKLGVKTVVNLRALHSDRKLLEGTGLGYVHIPLITWKVQEHHVLQFLVTATDPYLQPVFVHCQHGADRTGTMAAFYRLVVQGWTKDQALEEMTEGGFGYHEIWSNLIRLIRAMDLEGLKRKLEEHRRG
jgi:protein tyrosine phosphatase (PTP) superfamily phosphohydrolase (DUF442 family)